MTQKQIIYFLLVLVLAVLGYYLLPMIFDSTLLTVGVLFIIFPIYNVIANLLYTVKHGLHLIVPITLAVAFMPAAVLFYDMQHLLYGMLYLAVGLIGSTAGYTVYRKYHRTI